MKHLLTLYFFMSIFVLTISAQVTEEEIEELLNAGNKSGKSND